MSLLGCSVNGEAGVTISIQDRGLNYGDGLFETIALVNQQLIFWKQHYQRLLCGCNALGIQCPEEADLKNEIDKVLTSIAEKQKAVVKVMITRGDSERGYRIVEHARSNIIVMVSDYPHYPQNYWLEGVKVKRCQIMLATQKRLAGLKHLNRLEQVLARCEWDDEFQEGLIADQNGYVIEGVMSNLFIVKNSSVLTPYLTNTGVNGIMRNVVLNLCGSNGIIAKEDDLTWQHVIDADEVFLTNSIIGIWPVSSLDKQFFEVGETTKNITQLLTKEYSIDYATFSV